MHLICPDLHAQPRRVDSLREHLTLARQQHPDTQLILLGDTLDRGEGAAKTAAFLDEELSRGAVLLCGNHEAMAFGSTFGTGEASWTLQRIWDANGGVQWRRALTEAGRSWKEEVLRFGDARMHLQLGALHLLHARLPSPKGQQLIETAPHLKDWTAAQLLDMEDLALHLWGIPDPSQQVLSVHGHIERPEATWTGQALGLDLRNPSRLATATWDGTALHVRGSIPENAPSPAERSDGP